MKNKIDKKIGRKFLSIFLSVLIVTMTISISFSLSLPSVEAAERYGWCVETKDEPPRYCQGNDPSESNAFPESQCKRGFSTKKSSACQEVTCATSTGCMENIPKESCRKEYGGTPAVGDECDIGCCGIGGKTLGPGKIIITKKECKENALPEYPLEPPYFVFNTEIQDEKECSDYFEPYEKGCCITSSGCLYTTRELCQDAINFHGGIMCKQIPEVCQVQDIGKRCGKLPGNENKVVMLDSSGGEEILWECTTPAYACFECMEEQCYNEQQGEIPLKVNQFEGYCKSTVCEFENIGRDQKVMSDGKIKVSDRDKPLTLTNGHSICFNFYGVSSGHHKGNPKIDNAENIDVMAYRSTGLQNHKLVCNYGNIEVIGLGQDRKMLCKDTSEIIATTFTNEYESCHKCGEFSPGWKNVIGDFVSPAPILGRWMGKQISKQCQPDSCENIKSPEGTKLCFWDGDSYSPWGAHETGSCVPKYPPGTTDLCKECGGGGDYIWNICKQTECYALGNCQFEKHGGLTHVSIYLLSWIGFYGASRLGMVPFEALLRSLDKCGWNILCILPSYPHSFMVSITAIVTGPITFSVGWMLKGTIGFVKSLWDGVKDGLEIIKTTIDLF